ncbi:MAG TPA: hypothetical protein VL598_03260 [Trinickia sp.]|jgi:hypothetical protein|uniref:hypothetical protein n=1 Tax=Trinickia sp. TaxID=2571163 RepID=UPI002D1AC270|nr:hypothetical protein [Trinickia sp.]HTI16665.1 hypothetical protein [Trinickia sp.]
MRRAFHIAIVVLLGYLIADRAAMHAEAGQPGTITCAQGAELARSDAMSRGLSEAGAASQGEAFMASCLVFGQGQIYNRIARD